MSLKLYYHPFSSFCQKVLIALYENAIPFEPQLVDLGNEASRRDFLSVWPIGKFPVLRDEGARFTLPESTIIIEYLAENFPARTALIPKEPALALETRLWDRFFDNYVDVPMQKIVTDRLRRPSRHDPHGVADARTLLATSYDIIEKQMADKDWATGNSFTMADCAAAPALYYAGIVQPFTSTHPRLTAYFGRLSERPSFARVIEEAKPYRHLFPKEQPSP